MFRHTDARRWKTAWNARSLVLAVGTRELPPDPPPPASRAPHTPYRAAARVTPPPARRITRLTYTGEIAKGTEQAGVIRQVVLNSGPRGGARLAWQVERDSERPIVYHRHGDMLIARAGAEALAIALDSGALAAFPAATVAGAPAIPAPPATRIIEDSREIAVRGGEVRATAPPIRVDFGAWQASDLVAEVPGGYVAWLEREAGHRKELALALLFHDALGVRKRITLDWAPLAARCEAAYWVDGYLAIVAAPMAKAPAASSELRARVTYLLDATDGHVAARISDAGGESACADPDARETWRGRL